MLSALIACAALAPDVSDPDERLREHDLAGAAAAWAALHGEPLDLSHPAADALVRQSASNPSITAALIAETMRAVRLVESAPDTRTQEVDIPLESLTAYASCTVAILANSSRSATPNWLVAVGRSEVPVDVDPFVGGPTPFHGGRIVGWASDAAALTTLFARIDKDPPPRKVTLSLHGSGTDLHLFLTYRNGAWWALSASDAASAAHWITTCPSTLR